MNNTTHPIHWNMHWPDMVLDLRTTKRYSADNAVRSEVHADARVLATQLRRPIRVLDCGMVVLLATVQPDLASGGMFRGK